MLNFNLILYLSPSPDQTILSLLEESFSARDDFKVVFSSSETLHKHYSVQEGLVMLKMLEEEHPKLELTASTESSAIESWLEQNSLISVQEFEYSMMNQVEEGKTVVIYYFFKEDAPGDIKPFFAEANKHVKDDSILFVRGEFTSEDVRDVAELLRIEEFPAIGAFRIKNDVLNKYYLNSADLSVFVERVVKDEEEPFFFSESAEGKPKHVVVGTTFKEKVLESKETIILAVSSENCEECEEFKKAKEELLAKSKFTVLEMNGDLNEHGQFSFYNDLFVLFKGKTAEEREESLSGFEENYSFDKIEAWAEQTVKSIEASKFNQNMGGETEEEVKKNIEALRESMIEHKEKENKQEEKPEL